MNYFFCLEHPELSGHVTVSNYAPVGGRPAAREEMFVYAARPQSGQWAIRETGSLGPGDSRTYAGTDAFDSTEPGITTFFLYPDPLPSRVEKLPNAQIMDTRPAWRGNIQLRSQTMTASYQGEYPGGMLGIPNGTMVSLSPLVQDGDGIRTTLLFVNLQFEARIEPRALVIGRLRDQTPIDVREVMTNSCSVIELDGLTNDPTNPLCFFSPDTVGIPLYLSYDDGFHHMSIEHSHPPTEMLVFGNVGARRPVARELKDFWLERMCSDLQTA
jgi:hypothetical protein